MFFSIGYNSSESVSIPEIVSRYNCISEVYFAWPQTPSGRAPLADASKAKLRSDLQLLTQNGTKLTLLLNAACWGEKGFSNTLADKLRSTISEILRIAPLHAITAFSPMIAHLVKKDFPDIKTRASVNLKLGSINALQQAEKLFDEFTIQRELNYDIEKLLQIKKWANNSGKHIQLLANSGCCPDCPVQSFHDCMVAHERQSSDSDSYNRHIPGGCWQYLGNKANNYRFLAGTWIRPEDILHYESICDKLKLATRSHPDPEMVIRAYSKGRFRGNLPDLLEPGHAALFAPVVIDNSLLGKNWFTQKTATQDFHKLEKLYRNTWPKVTLDTSACT